METLLILWISEKKQLTITNTIGNRHAQCTTMQACIVGLFVCLYWQSELENLHTIKQRTIKQTYNNNTTENSIAEENRGGWGDKLEYLPTDKQTIKQSLIQKLRPPYPLWSVDTRVAGQFFVIHNREFFRIP